MHNTRRPLKTRNLTIIKNIAHYLGKKNVTPNQISIAGIIFSVLSAISFILLPFTNWIFALFAAIFIQLRLLCNVLDGLVALEEGKKTLSGELYNDIPDRIADCFILIAAGYAVNFPILGWCAALLAVATAYIRTLATSIGAPTRFLGPMAKPHRMAIMTIACILDFIDERGYGIIIALLIIILGSIITIYRRTATAYKFLENKDAQ